jgi:hypothetical protein
VRALRDVRQHLQIVARSHQRLSRRNGEIIADVREYL